VAGDQGWRVRFLAQHAAIIYYFVLIIVWVLSPSLAYNFSELIEAHAVDTYAEFAESNKVMLLCDDDDVIMVMMIGVAQVFASSSRSEGILRSSRLVRV